MKLFFFILLIGALSICQADRKESNNEIQGRSLQDTLTDHGADTILYAQQIQPILIKHCSPCHFQGGKLYEKLPFDNPKTIVGHEAGVLKRIKDTGDVELIKKYIKQNI